MFKYVTANEREPPTTNGSKSHKIQVETNHVSNVMERLVICLDGCLFNSRWTNPCLAIFILFLDGSIFFIGLMVVYYLFWMDPFLFLLGLIRVKTILLA